jgi:hypothetical protein
LSSLIGLAFAGIEQIHAHADLGMNSNLGIFAQTAVYAEHRIFGALGKNSHLEFSDSAQAFRHLPHLSGIQLSLEEDHRPGQAL